MYLRKSCLPLLLICTVVLLNSVALSQTSPSSTNALGIHVTQVQGGAQFRSPGQPKWTTLTNGSDLSEGVELRTGPKGVIQFTIGTDQIFRVDRLSVVRVVRAALQSDGTIHTDVGMSYGRVSKDVDVPQAPHDDTIQSPSSTLAVRGTRVSLYDQPPYAPEAVSLTGAAVWHNPARRNVDLGAKNGGTARIAGNAPSAGQYNIATRLIDPRGTFAARTDADETDLQNLASYGGPDFRQLGLFGLHRQSADFLTATPVQALFFQLTWQGTPFSNVDLDVTTPSGYTLSNTNRISPDGGFKPAPNGIANALGLGSELVEFPNGFPGGPYTITIINQTRGAAQSNVHLEQTTNGAITRSQTLTDNLSAINARATHSVTLPLTPAVHTQSAKR